MIVELAIAPVLAHARMHHVLADGSEFVRQQGVQSLDEFRASFHDLLLSQSWNSNMATIFSVVTVGIAFKPPAE
jgi:DNA-binding GntR family transcriptional regulator